MTHVYFGLAGWVLAIFVAGMGVGAWVMARSVRRQQEDALRVIRLAEEKGIKLR